MKYIVYISLEGSVLCYNFIPTQTQKQLNTHGTYSPTYSKVLLLGKCYHFTLNFAGVYFYTRQMYFILVRLNLFDQRNFCLMNVHQQLD